MRKEIFKDVVGYEGLYKVSNLGRVRDINGIVKLGNKKGYKTVLLKFRGKSKSFLVHRLVAIAFVKGNKSLVVNHKDGVKDNNLADNLEWVSIAENSRHAVLNGLHPKSTKLTIDEIKLIKKLASYNCFTSKQIAEYFDISINHAYKIINNHNWADVEFDQTSFK